MSLIKNGSEIEVAGDEVIGMIKIMRSGKVRVEAPTMHPATLIKHLQSTVADIIYASFQPADISKIQT